MKKLLIGIMLLASISPIVSASEIILLGPKNGKYYARGYAQKTSFKSFLDRAKEILIKQGYSSVQEISRKDFDVKNLADGDLVLDLDATVLSGVGLGNYCTVYAHLKVIKNGVLKYKDYSEAKKYQLFGLTNYNHSQCAKSLKMALLDIKQNN